MTGGRSRTATVAALQALALIALLLALAGVGGLDDRARPGVLVLVDRSLSVPRPDADAALAALRRAEPGARVEAIEFAGRPARVASLRSGARDEADGREPSNDIEPSATNLERAVDTALAASAQRPYASLVIVSDGRANAGDAARALASARDAGLPVLWLTAARSAPRAWIADMQAPTRARRGQAIPIVVPVAGDMTAPLRITATLRDAAGAERTVSATPDALGLATLRTTADRSGPLRISLSLMDADSGKVLDARRDAAVVDVLEPARLLYLRGSPGPLAVSLATGGWDLETAPARRAEDFRERLGGYEAVVLDDVSREDVGDGFWQALAGEVRTRGLGLLVLGGERAFARVESGADAHRHRDLVRDVPEGHPDRRRDPQRPRPVDERLLERERGIPLRRMALHEDAQHQPRGRRQVPGEREVHEHSVDAVGRLADVLEERHAALHSRAVRRSRQRR